MACIRPLWRATRPWPTTRAAPKVRPTSRAPRSGSRPEAGEEEMSTMDRLSYDTGASDEAQGNIQTVIAPLEQVISDRDQAVKAAMADFYADGGYGLYHAQEVRWTNADHDGRAINRL